MKKQIEINLLSIHFNLFSIDFPFQHRKHLLITKGFNWNQFTFNLFEFTLSWFSSLNVKKMPWQIAGALFFLWSVSFFVIRKAGPQSHENLGSVESVMHLLREQLGLCRASIRIWVADCFFETCVLEPIAGNVRHVAIETVPIWLQFRFDQAFNVFFVVAFVL